MNDFHVAQTSGVLPVLLPLAERMTRAALRERAMGSPTLRLDSSHGVALIVAFLCGCGIAQAQSQAADPSIFTTLWKWTPLLARGFVFNLAISLAMEVHKIALPVFGVTIPIPDWTKATLGLALPVMANVSEIVRGAIQSIPTTQWEAAASLAFNRRQTLWMIIFPQCIKRMLPPWMNLYAILTMATVLASIVGVNEMMTLTQRALSAESRPGLLLAFYSYVLLWFFLYCYPIARWTVRLEARYAVNQ